MTEYFSAIQAHLSQKCLIDSTDQPSSPIIVSLGDDNMIYRYNTESRSGEHFNVQEEIICDALAISPDASHCLISGPSNSLLRFNFLDNSMSKIYEAMGFITSIKYAPSGNYIVIGSQQGKAIILDPYSERKQKCRPGHSGAIISIALTKSSNLLATIGKDQNVLIYKINLNEQPQEVARYSITKLQNCSDLKCSFSLNENILYVSGQRYLQKIQIIQNRWQYSKINSMSHESEIILTQVVNSNTLVTSTYNQIHVWNIREQQKRFVIQSFFLNQIVVISDKFYGSKNDGKIYQFKRDLRQDLRIEEPMDIQIGAQNDVIQFNQQNEQQQQKLEQDGMDEEQQQQREIEFQHYKKSKADKIITCFPQQKLKTSTQFFKQSRFLYVNLYGCVTETQQTQESKIIEVQLQPIGKKKMQKIILSKTQSFQYFCINQLGIAYANQTTFGFKPSSEINQEWTCKWNDIEGIAMGSGWISVINNSQVKILNMTAHQIRSFSFDRQIVAIRAFQNILVVVYHESVPLFGSQHLSMQLFLIDALKRQSNMISNSHVPITPKYLLRWFDFSREGMLFSQDQTGSIRVFSLQTSQWTKLIVDQIDNLRKVWMIGIKNYMIQYWKTTDVDPEPTVAQRFIIKSSQFSIPTSGNHPANTQQIYQKLLWKRFILDHEKARTRLWGYLQLTRNQNNIFYNLSGSILYEKSIDKKHLQLDKEYQSLIKKYLKEQQIFKAFLLAQSSIRTQQSARRVVQLFDLQNHRGLAIQLEQYCDQLEKQAEYVTMQQLQLKRLQQEAQRTIKPRSEDPMKRGASKKTAESIIFPSQGFLSQDSMDLSSEKLNRSKISNQQENYDMMNNPCLKKKSNHQNLQAKKRQITQHIQKFGVKQKAQKKNMNKTISK